MKKIILSVLAIAAMATTANAQLWFGGSLGFSHDGGVIKTKEADTDKPKPPIVMQAFHDQSYW